MSPSFLDANIIIRHVTKDNARLSQKARVILKQIEIGELEVTTSETVLAECVFVLTSKNLYSFSRKDVQQVLRTVLSLKGLKLPLKEMYVHAADLYATSALDFIDAIAVVQMERQNIDKIYSFDRHFDGVEGITRLEK